MNVPNITYLYLIIAIGFEVAAISFLQASAQYTRPWAVLAMVLCNLVMFYCLSLVLLQMPLGVTYALWSGIGIVLIAVAGFVLFGQKLDMRAIAGIGLIVAGVVVLKWR